MSPSKLKLFFGRGGRAVMQRLAKPWPLRRSAGSIPAPSAQVQANPKEPQPLGVDWDEEWPVYPEGIEGFFINRATEKELDDLLNCFVCNKPMPTFEESMAEEIHSWRVPGHGAAHEGCYEEWVER